MRERTVNRRLQHYIVSSLLVKPQVIDLYGYYAFFANGTQLAMSRVPRQMLGKRTSRRYANTMNTMLLKLYIKLQDLTSREEGQDLVEYALVVALIAFGATAGMKALAGGLNTAFGQISTTLGSYVS